MTLLDDVQTSLLSSAGLTLRLGVVATLVRADLKFREPLDAGLFTYLPIAMPRVADAQVLSAESF